MVKLLQMTPTPICFGRFQDFDFATAVLHNMRQLCNDLDKRYFKFDGVDGSEYWFPAPLAQYDGTRRRLHSPQ
jgi:hypothetical protein